MYSVFKSGEVYITEFAVWVYRVINKNSLGVTILKRCHACNN